VSRQKQRERSQHAVDEAQSALGKAEQELDARPRCVSKSSRSRKS
jgi:hypothetical protein